MWRNTHPYVVVDRVEDVTSPAAIKDDPKCDRDITFYGYVRGTHLKKSMKVHLIGGGDFSITSITALEDPCPLPGQTERSSLKTKDQLLFAPMANVGRVKMDRDGLYIDIKYDPLFPCFYFHEIIKIPLYIKEYSLYKIGKLRCYG